MTKNTVRRHCKLQTHKHKTSIIHVHTQYPRAHTHTHTNLYTERDTNASNPVRPPVCLVANKEQRAVRAPLRLLRRLGRAARHDPGGAGEVRTRERGCRQRGRASGRRRLAAPQPRRGLRSRRLARGDRRGPGARPAPAAPTCDLPGTRRPSHQPPPAASHPRASPARRGGRAARAEDEGRGRRRVSARAARQSSRRWNQGAGFAAQNKPAAVALSHSDISI